MIKQYRYICIIELTSNENEGISIKTVFNDVKLNVVPVKRLYFIS